MQRELEHRVLIQRLEERRDRAVRFFLIGVDQALKGCEIDDFERGVRVGRDFGEGLVGFFEEEVQLEDCAGLAVVFGVVGAEDG